MHRFRWGWGIFPLFPPRGSDIDYMEEFPFKMNYLRFSPTFEIEVRIFQISPTKVTKENVSFF